MNGRLQEDDLSPGTSFFLRRNCRKSAIVQKPVTAISPRQLHCILAEAMVWDEQLHRRRRSSVLVSPVNPPCGITHLRWYLGERSIPQRVPGTGNSLHPEAIHNT